MYNGKESNGDFMDITKIMEKTFELADALKHTKDYQLYLKYENMVLNDEDLNKLVDDFNHKKASFLEASQYGKHYPGFKQIKYNYQQAKIELMKNDMFEKYKGYEKEIDLYLYRIENQIKQLLNIIEKHDKSLFKFM